MDIPTLAALATAIIAVTLGHTIRALRWRMLLPERYSRSRFDLLLGLGVGYAANFLVPFRLGEILRAAIVTVRTKKSNGGQAMASISASILAERVTDLPLAALLLGLSGVTGFAMPASMIVGATLFLALGHLVQKSSRGRRMIWILTSPFRHSLRLSIAHGVSEYGQIITQGVFLTPRYIIATTLMWSSYLLSYAALAIALKEHTGTTLALFLEQPLTPLLSKISAMPDGPDQIVRMSMVIVFALVPVAAILLSGSRELRAIWTTARNRLDRKIGNTGVATMRRPSMMRDHYEEQTVYDSFLGDFFSGRKTLATQFCLALEKNVIVHRFLHGGSDALTGIVEKNGAMNITKYAVQGPAKKLQEQVEWLERARTAGISVTDCLNPQIVGTGYRYDMPVIHAAQDFYDVIHSVDTSTSRSMLRAIVDRVDTYHRAHLRTADPASIEDYLAKKVLPNLNVIVEFLRIRFGETVPLNGMNVDLKEFEILTDLAWLSEQVVDAHVTDVHGDLTIDNVIASSTRPEGYYIIDPNPDNIFNTPLIDWSKMMQSLHLGYEAMNRLTPDTQTDQIVVPLIRSERYANLHEMFEGEMISRVGAERLREVYFHEIVNYLRLTPYKIRKDPNKGLIFAGATLILLLRYRQRYGI